MKKQNKKGFSLLELVLVLGVGSMMAFMRFQDMKNEQETIMANAVGQQIKQVGEAVNGYINIRYDKLSTLTSSSSQSSDPGPRVCNASGCEITYQTLVNEGLLPASHTGINAQKSSYKIILKRSGSIPNYVINGLITTTLPWMEGDKYRYDLLGRAMQAAGIDSGMTQSATLASGLQGAWKETSTVYSNITSAGLMAYRVGYDSAMYSVYLRRDGTLPMTGNLNMGANDIDNAKNITASGTGDFGSDITSGGTVTAAGQVIAHNGYGDMITFGGDAANNDYEIRLGAAKQLTLYSPSAGNYTTVLQVNRNVKIDQRLGIMGYDPNDLPAGWGGGLRTLDVYAAGTLATGSGGNLTSYMNVTGVHTQSNITASGNITAGGDITGNGVYGNYIHSNGNIDANGRVNVGEFVYINGQANLGAGCSPNGLQGRSSDGSLLSCVNGLWSNSFSGEISSNSFNLGFSGTINLGVQKFCAIGSYRSDSEDDGQCQVYKSGANWYITTSQQSYVGCSAVCFK